MGKKSWWLPSTDAPGANKIGKQGFDLVTLADKILLKLHLG